MKKPPRAIEGVSGSLWGGPLFSSETHEPKTALPLSPPTYTVSRTGVRHGTTDNSFRLVSVRHKAGCNTPHASGSMQPRFVRVFGSQASSSVSCSVSGCSSTSQARRASSGVCVGMRATSYGPVSTGFPNATSVLSPLFGTMRYWMSCTRCSKSVELQLSEVRPQIG